MDSAEVGLNLLTGMIQVDRIFRGNKSVVTPELLKCFARSEKGILGNQGVAYKRLDCTTSFIINILSFSFGVVLTAKVDTKDITRSTAGSRL